MTGSAGGAPPVADRDQTVSAWITLLSRVSLSFFEWSETSKAPQPDLAPSQVPPAPGPFGPQRISRSALLGLALLCGTLFTLRLNAPFLHEDNEARFATVAREMAQRGEWFTPQFQGRPVQKPPFVFWMMAAAQAVLGNSELAARVPSAIAALAAVLVTASLGARLYGAHTGVLAAVLLATMFQFAWVGRKGQLDMPFTAFIVGAHALLFRALREGKGHLWAGGWACAALSAMVKGLAGVLLPLGTGLTYALMMGRAREFVRPPAWRAMAGAGAALVVYYAALGAGFTTKFFMDDHLRRFLSGVDLVRPLWWHVPVFVLGILPYAAWLPFAVAAGSAVRHRDLWRRGRPNHGGCDHATFLVCWFVLWFILISMSKGKEEHYVLPLLPPLAMLMAAGVVQTGIRVPTWWARWAIGAVPVSVSVGSALFMGYLARAGILTAWSTVAFGLLALAGIAAAWGSFRWDIPRTIAVAMFTGILTSLAVITAGLPPLERARTSASMAAVRAIRAVVGEAPLVSYGRPYTPTPRVTFYLNLHLPEPLRRLETRDELEEFLRADTTHFLLLNRPDWEALGQRHALGRPVAGRVVAGPTDYILLGPPAR